MSFANRVAKRGPLYLLPFSLMAAFTRLLLRYWVVLKFKAYGVRVGQKNHIGTGLRFVFPWNICIGNRCFVGARVRLWCEAEEGLLVISDGAQVGRECVLDFTGGLSIGEGALISEGCIVYTHDHGYDPHSKPDAKPLKIGKGAWIGARAIILPSVREIGENAIVGAGAVVSRDVPDDHVYVGSSGRLLRKRGKDNA
jgi:hypothetical protein